MIGPILGIDLGTTNSACGVWQNGEVRLIPNRLGEYLTPSVVGIDDSGLISVGQVAKEQLLSQPTRTIAAFKRMMGTKYPVKLGTTSFTATELSSIVLQALKEDAENHLKISISEAVISVPAYFNDNQRYATKEAAELAGLKVSRLINEPTAAALAFGLKEKGDGTFIVLDLGGGTFDVSILEYFDDIMEVHASAGDNHLGGEDFTRELTNFVVATASVDIEKLTDKEKAEMYWLSERAKKAVNSGQDFRFQYDDQSHQIDIPINAKTFAEATQTLLSRVRLPVEKALRDANLTTAGVNDVLLVGGATRMTNFRSAVGKMFQKIPTSNVDPDLVVAIGAAIQAGLKERDEALDDIVLTDVCPYSLGVEVVNPYNQFEAGYFLPIIERNCTVPVSRVDTLQTVGDNQKMIEVSIFQGESRRTTKNIELGKLRIDVPKKKAGEETVDVRFSYDMNGLLEVDVTVNSSGKVFSKVIEQAPGALTEAEKRKARQRLAHLKFHPREDEQNRVALARGEALYEIASGDERNAIDAIIAAFENELASQDPLRIERARSRLLDELAAYEKSPIL